MMVLLLVAYSAIVHVGFSTVYTLTKGERALRGYFGPPPYEVKKQKLLFTNFFLLVY